MPLFVNYAANPENQQDKKVFVSDMPPFGRNELHGGWGGLHPFESEPGHWSFWKQGYASASRCRVFTTCQNFEKDPKHDAAVQKFGQTACEMYQWMADNIEGPWLVFDGMSQYDRRHDLEIYIERFDQRAAFKKTHFFKEGFEREIWESDQFRSEYAPGLTHEIHELAIVKGVVPPYTELENYSTWVWHAANGYYDGFIEMNGVEHHYIEPVCEEIAAVLKAEPVIGKALYTLQEDGKYICSCEQEKGNFTAWNAWQNENCAINLHPKDVKQPDFAEHGSYIEFKYPSIEEVFNKNWGPYFKYDAQKKYYMCSQNEYPRPERRVIPQNFIEYLHGNGPDPSPKLV